MERILNFSAGPATLPLEVIEEAQAQFVNYNGIGMSLMESSHRGKAYDAVHQEAISNIKELLGIDDEYAVLLLQGGASTQFSMIPMNLLPAEGCAAYVQSGAWAGKAIKEAAKIGKVHIAADTAANLPTRVPTADELDIPENAAYLHITSNETISGAQWKQFPTPKCPLIADMSSDILSCPVNGSDFGLIYAGAQKNLGPSGVTVVAIRKSLAESAPQNLPTMFDYRTHIEKDSLFNTPPTFSIYMLMLVTRWIKSEGPTVIFERNRRKAQKLYDAIDSSGFYTGSAEVSCRSDMNITFRLPSEELEKQFIAEAETKGFSGLKGHRSVGGARASIYNAFPESGVDSLIQYMAEFQRTRG